ERREAHAPNDLVELAEGRLDLRQQVDRAGACRFLAVVERYAAAELALDDELAAGVETDLAGYEQQLADSDAGDVVRDRTCRRGENDPEFRELFLDGSGHDGLLLWMSVPGGGTLSSPIGRRRASRRKSWASRDTGSASRGCTASAATICCAAPLPPSK